MEPPIFTMEIQRMSHTLKMMLSEHTLKLDRDMKAAVDAYCEGGNIERLLNEQVPRILNEVIAEEVERYFKYEEGRYEIRKLVAEALDKKLAI